MAVGAVAGMVAYKAMGFKGIVGLILLYLALKRVMTMGSKVIQNQRLDLVARTMQDGLPVDRNGRIDPEVLDALWLPRAKPNGYKPGGLEWDLLPLDFLRQIR
jgi:hypothetical protein